MPPLPAPTTTSRGIRHPAARVASRTDIHLPDWDREHSPPVRERLPARLRARRRLHHPDRDRRSGRQRRGRARDGARVRRRRGRRRGVPRAVPDGLFDRRPRDAGCRPRRRRDGDRTAGRGIRRSLPDARRRRAAAPPQPPLQLRGRDPSRRAARRRAEVVPADLSRVLRAPLVRARRRPGRARTSASATSRRRSGPTCSSRPSTCPGLVVHAEVCEDVWVPIPPSSQAALAGATVLLNLSGSPITIARAEDRKDLCQSQSLRCLAAYAYAAAGMGESTNDLSWDGQTMIYEGGALLAETERFPDGPRRIASRTSTSTASGRIACGRARSTTTAAPTTPLLPHRALRARPARRATSGCGARSTGSRSCPTTRPGSRRTATRRSTSRCPGSCSACRRSAARSPSSA